MGSLGPERQERPSCRRNRLGLRRLTDRRLLLELIGRADHVLDEFEQELRDRLILGSTPGRGVRESPSEAGEHFPETPEKRSRAILCSKQ